MGWRGSNLSVIITKWDPLQCCVKQSHFTNYTDMIVDKSWQINFSSKLFCKIQVPYGKYNDQLCNNTFIAQAFGTNFYKLCRINQITISKFYADGECNNDMLVFLIYFYVFALFKIKQIKNIFFSLCPAALYRSHACFSSSSNRSELKFAAVVLWDLDTPQF